MNIASFDPTDANRKIPTVYWQTLRLTDLLPNMYRLEEQNETTEEATITYTDHAAIRGLTFKVSPKECPQVEPFLDAAVRQTLKSIGWHSDFPHGHETAILLRDLCDLLEDEFKYQTTVIPASPGLQPKRRYRGYQQAQQDLMVRHAFSFQQIHTAAARIEILTPEGHKILLERVIL